MSAWDIYRDRASVHGRDRHEATLLRETSFINRRLPQNLSYTTVDVYPEEYGYNIDSSDATEHMFKQDVAIIDSDNLDEKMVMAMPGENIDLGSLIYWMGTYWLVTEKDFNSTVRTRVKVTQCNYILKWVADDDTIIEQWSIFEDSTKYLTGHLEDKYFMTTRGDARSALTLAKNDYSVQLGHENRFLIGDPDDEHKSAFLLTKALKGAYMYEGKGVYQFVLQEVVATEWDNQELSIADYYKHFPEEMENYGGQSGGKNHEEHNTPATPATDDGRKVWL